MSVSRGAYIASPLSAEGIPREEHGKVEMKASCRIKFFHLWTVCARIGNLMQHRSGILPPVTLSPSPAAFHVPQT